MKNIQREEILKKEFDAYSHQTDIIMKSLKTNHEDYIYNKKKMEEILKECKKEQISIVYDIHYENNTLDYIHLIPVRFFGNVPENLALQLDLKEIGKDISWRKVGIKKH